MNRLRRAPHMVYGRISRGPLGISDRAAVLRAARVLRGAGYTIGEQAAVFGISGDTFFTWLRKAGMPTSGDNTRAVHRYILTGRHHRAALKRAAQS